MGEGACPHPLRATSCRSPVRCRCFGAWRPSKASSARSSQRRCRSPERSVGSSEPIGRPILQVCPAWAPATTRRCRAMQSSSSQLVAWNAIFRQRRDVTASRSRNGCAPMERGARAPWRSQPSSGPARSSAGPARVQSPFRARLRSQGRGRRAAQADRAVGPGSSKSRLACSWRASRRS